jgi:hypothetical protein
VALVLNTLRPTLQPVRSPGLAVVQSGGVFTDTDPDDGPLGTGVSDGGPKGLTAT